MIERTLKKEIREWIQDGQEALLVTGARQTGKTFLIRQCLQEECCDYTELNFIERPELISIFEKTTDTKDLLFRLSAASTKPLQSGKTIFFLDEIQECRELVTKVKFLVDEGSCRFIMSGSLLGIELSDIRSAPVGYLRILDLFPLDLEEFARAAGVHEETFTHLRTCFEMLQPVDAFIHNKMLDLFYLYLIIGGMPRAVDEYLNTNDLRKTAQIHQMIIRLYKQDFSKYETNYKLRLQEIYDAMPGELNSPNKRFHINKLGKGTSYDRVANDFLWLKDAGVALPVYNLKEPRLPFVMNASRNLFKLFFSDVGLLTSLYSDQTKLKILDKNPDINKGALFENAVAQELASHHMPLYYFNSKSQGELDFVTEMDGEAIPIEVKSGKAYNRHNALCNVLKNDNYKIHRAYILSTSNIETDGKKIYLPVYMMMFLRQHELKESQRIYKIDLTGI